MSQQKILDDFEALLSQTIREYVKKHNLIINKITVEGDSIVFEILSMNEDNQFKTATYSYGGSRKNSIWGK